MESRLLALPTELQLMIYELVFSPAAEHVDLLKAREQRPRWGLLKVCNQIYFAAKPFYDIAKRDYWGTTHFRLHQSHKGTPVPTVTIKRQIHSPDIEKVRHVEIIESLTDSITILYDHGIWTVTRHGTEEDASQMRSHECSVMETFIRVEYQQYRKMCEHLSEMQISRRYMVLDGWSFIALRSPLTETQAEILKGLISKTRLEMYELCAVFEKHKVMCRREWAIRKPERKLKRLPWQGQRDPRK